MTLRSARLVAFDGTHASGKTTLLYAVASSLRRRGVHVGVLDEPARRSPFVDDVVIHKAGDFDMLLELDLFAAQLTSCIRGARSYDVVLADKTLTNVLAYCKMVVATQPDTWDGQMVEAMATFCRAFGTAYDAVFYCQDFYGVSQPGDEYRSRVAHLQAKADELVRAEYTALDQPLTFVPRGLDVDGRTSWVTDQMNRMHLLTPKESLDEH